MKTAPKIYLNKHFLMETLVDWLPEHQKAFAHTMAYKVLVNAFFNYLKADDEDRAFEKQLFEQAKLNFDHLCQTQKPSS